MSGPKDDGALPLSDLERWVLPSTFAWLQEGDAKRAAIEAEIDDDEAGYANFLFSQEEKLRGIENERGEQEPASGREVFRWSSSRINPDGFTGSISAARSTEDGTVNIIYVLNGESLAGFGDQVWASSRHISQCLADASTCRKLLGDNHEEEEEEASSSSSSSFTHPLLGKTFLELGAGGAVPSWTALNCGARVVCTDQAVTDRVRSMAESAQLNYEEMKSAFGEDDERVVHASRAKVCPYDWGASIDELTQALGNKEERFDVIVAADCVFKPWLHDALLSSIDLALSPNGVCFLPFGLHGNAPDEQVMSIGDKAKERGFKVSKLETKQLTPQKSCMEAKQAFVHTFRLSR